MHNHDNDDEHVSDKLDTRDDMSGFDVKGRPKYIKFKQKLMSKDFQFEVGMEFSSLRQFKDAILFSLVDKWCLRKVIQLDAGSNASASARVLLVSYFFE